MQRQPHTGPVVRGSQAAAPKRRSDTANPAGAARTTSTTTPTSSRESKAFDPTAYAALIAIAAAEKRLRQSHSRGASTTTARPSSLHRPRSEPSLDAPAYLPETSLHTARDHHGGESDSAQRYTPPAPSTCHSSDAAVGARTLLEQLALASESSSSVASDESADPTGVEFPRLVERSASPPATAPLRAPQRAPARTSAASSSSSSSASPPAVEPAVVSHTADVAPPLPRDTESEDAMAFVSLRDASPLRERSVVDSAGISYRVVAVEGVHAVAQRLNFSFYV